MRIEIEDAAKVIEMLCEGVGIRAISRLTRLDQKTVLNILESSGQHSAALLDAKLRNLKLAEIQIDEIYSFVNCLQQNTTADDKFRGDQYAFLAIAKQSKLIVHHLIGKRDKENATTFLRGLKARMDGKFQLTSDGFNAYCGYLGSVFQVFRESIDYAIEIKHFASTNRTLTGKGNRRENPVICQSVKRIPCIGNPDRASITVNHAERTNLSVRLFNRRFTRKTLGFSKTLKYHRHAVALMIAHFNFCRVHSAIDMTPAMAAGLTDHVWKVAELLEQASN